MKKYLPHLAAVVTMIFWGLSYLSTRLVILDIAPTLAVLYRFTLASFILFLLLKLRGRKLHILKADRKKLFLAGLTGVALNFTLENLGVKYTSTANVALLVATIPAITLLFENRRLKRKSGWRELLGISMSILGIMMMSLAGQIDGFTLSLFGDAMVLLSSFSWAIYTVLLSDLSGDYDSMELTLYTNFFGALCMIPTVFFTGIQIPGRRATFHLVYLVLFCSIVAYVLYMWALKKLGGIRVNTYINIQPIVGMLASLFILKETLTGSQLLGAIIITIGVWQVNRAMARQELTKQELTFD